MRYPTAEYILAVPQKFRPDVLRFVRAWKRANVGHRRSPESLRALIGSLAVLYGRPVTVRFADGVADHYSPADRCIVLNAAHPSIVTALHELAHHLFGRSEFKACRWSIWLFKRTFPRTFARGTFVGHMFRLSSSRVTFNAARPDVNEDRLREALRVISLLPRR